MQNYPSEPHRVRFWQVEESVGPTNYIILPGIHMCELSAIKAFPAGSQNCRAVEYQQGQGNKGAERVWPTTKNAKRLGWDREAINAPVVDHLPRTGQNGDG